MISALALFGLHPIKLVSGTLADPFWRWPLIALVVSSAGLTTYPCEAAWRTYRRKKDLRNDLRAVDLAARNRRALLLQRLQKLTDGERRVLRGFWSAHSRTRELGAFSGDVPSLAREGLIEQITPGGSYETAVVFKIANEVWECLEQNPKLLDVPS
jgi:hypothetical protein